MPYDNSEVIPTVTSERYIQSGLQSFSALAKNYLGIDPPYDVEIGIVGMKGMRLSLRQSEFMNQMSNPLHFNEMHIRRVLNEVSQQSINVVAHDFLHEIYDLAGLEF
jgi:hypothetical protein